MGRYVVHIILVCAFACVVFAESGEEGYMKADRPGKESGPTQVYFYVFVVDIDDIDGPGQSFSANIFLRLRWKDERLAREDDSVRTVSLAEVWNPRLVIVNQQGFLRMSLPEIVEVQPDGTVTYFQRYNGTLSQPLKLSEFPFDQHRFAITFGTAGYSPKDVQFLPDRVRDGMEITGGDIRRMLSVPDWAVTDYQVESRPFEAIKGVKTSGIVAEFTARRYAIYYIWQVIVPLFLIVMMSWGGFWIDPTNAGAQIGVATSSIITLIAYRFMLGGLIPHLPYMTRLDYFTLGSTILVFLTLVEVVITTKLAHGKLESVGRRVDRWCRVVFPATFILWSIWSLIL